MTTYSINGGYRHPDLLWTPAELQARLTNETVTLIDVRAGELFASEHIPGARHFNVYGLNVYDTDEAPLDSFIRMWAFMLGRCGIAREDTVVFYEEDSGMSAARGFWFLEYLGHEKVHVLNGGLRVWKNAGLPTTQQAEAPTPAVYEYARVRDRIATHHDMLEAVGDTDKVILDTRGDGEWFGTEKRATRNGTIPSAVHLDWTQHLTEEGRYRTGDELRELFERRGITPDKEILAFCNTGYRSAHAYLALRLLGYPRVRNYVGSWQEWGNRERLPVVTPNDPRVAPRCGKMPGR